MTPQERQLVGELFDRVATLENAPRDAEAQRTIADGLARAPHAPYALVQTVLVQDEALKRADARIRELESQLGMSPEPQRPGGFLDSMRDSLFGRREEPRGSVSPVGGADRPMGVPPGFGTRAPDPAGPTGPGVGSAGVGAPPASQGGSFLGTAAAAAAGAIGGALLLGSIRSMFGGQHSPSGAHDPYAAPGPGEMPWGKERDLASGDLRQVGMDDIGRPGVGPSRSFEPGHERGGAGLFGPTEDVEGGDDLDYDGGFDTADSV